MQYNEWKGGGLIAVSYEARKYGVKRYENLNLMMKNENVKETMSEHQSSLLFLKVEEILKEK